MPPKKKPSEPRKSHLGLPKMLLTLDMFGAPLPAFNMQGEDTVRTHCGGCISLAIMYVTFLFATLKLQQLQNRIGASPHAPDWR